MTHIICACIPCQMSTLNLRLLLFIQAGYRLYITYKYIYMFRYLNRNIVVSCGLLSGRGSSDFVIHSNITNHGHMLLTSLKFRVRGCALNNYITEHHTRIREKM